MAILSVCFPFPIHQIMSEKSDFLFPQPSQTETNFVKNDKYVKARKQNIIQFE